MFLIINVFLLAGSWELVTTYNWAYNPGCFGVTYKRPVRETTGGVRSPCISSY